MQSAVDYGIEIMRQLTVIRFGEDGVENMSRITTAQEEEVCAFLRG